MCVHLRSDCSVVKEGVPPSEGRLVDDLVGKPGGILTYQ
jgi:hypothetical protein